MKRIVIKLSGKVFDNPSKESLTDYASMLQKISSKVQPIIIAGGGPVARIYISLARALGADESSLDDLGIAVSRLNAKLLIYALDAYSKVPEDLEEVSQAVESGKIVVTGGLHAGQSTNATAALIAERVKATAFINATDVDGIYTMDPRKDQKAILLKSISVRDLRAMLIDESTAAGAYDLMDIVALKVIERSHIPTRVVRADPEIIRRVIDGEDLGTAIVS